DQNRMLGGAHNEGLVGNDHFSRDGIEHHGVHLGKVSPTDLRIIGWKHVLGLPPRSVALDNAGDRHIADGERSHLVLPGLPAALAQRGRSRAGFPHILHSSLLLLQPFRTDAKDPPRGLPPSVRTPRHGRSMACATHRENGEFLRRRRKPRHQVMKADPRSMREIATFPKFRNALRRYGDSHEYGPRTCPDSSRLKI